MSNDKLRTANGRRFQALVFDLFNTILHFDETLLPEVEVSGLRFRTTGAAVYRQLSRQRNVEFSEERFLEEFLESRRRLMELWGPELREYPSRRRFELMAEVLEIEDESAIDLMVEAHMEEMYRMIYLPERNRTVLQRLGDQPVFLASNFDHAPTARRALRKHGLEGDLDEIFISHELGWRKPGRRFFETIIAATGIDPARCLFIGDDPVCDVWGASQAGFQTAWLPRPGAKTPQTEPSWVLKKLEDVLEIVNR